VLSVILGGKGKALKFLVPFLNKYKKERELQEKNPVSFDCGICYVKDAYELFY
jgi:hypothetical protein